MEWASCTEGLPFYGIGFSIGCFSQTDLASVGVNLVELLVESGMMDAIASLFKAHELRGPSMLEEANVGFLCYAAWGLTNLDITAPEGLPIMEMLKGMPSALYFLLEHKLTLYVQFGSNTSSWAAVGAAAAAAAAAAVSAVSRCQLQPRSNCHSACRCCARWHLGKKRLMLAQPPFRSPSKSLMMS